MKTWLIPATFTGVFALSSASCFSQQQTETLETADSLSPLDQRPQPWQRRPKKHCRQCQQLGYATSPDGIRWTVRDKPLYRSGRSPSIIREAPDRYRMWMGSKPDFDVASGGLYGNIYKFHSVDGTSWTRSAQPVLRPAAPARSVVYPFVIREGDTWYIWHGCHVDGGRFELFCAASKDGTDWSVDHSRPAFPAAEGKQRFDSRYTSTPCIVRLQDRLLLYYSARDWQTEYIDGSGKKRRDGAGVYSHIGVAELLLK
ncbi:MAG: hypothetical protein P8J37_06100 [Fuerstiella sp.]|nr:hypothetical protein [Fuerstiella sp.]